MHATGDDRPVTSRATAELDAIFAYIAKHNPRAAARVVNRIEYLADSLSQFPHKGVVLRRRGIRKLVATPYPYLILYRVLCKSYMVLGVGLLRVA